MKSYRVKVRSPREWGIDFSSKKKELKKRNAKEGRERNKTPRDYGPRRELSNSVHSGRKSKIDFL